MTVLGIVGGVVQPVVIVAGSPLLVGVMRQVRARLEGRAGAGIWQPWRDLRKLFGKERITPRGTSEVFRVAPLVLVATTVVVAVVAPFVTTDSAIDPVADLFAVVALLALGAVALALAGLDLALVELASAMRLSVFLGLLANLFLPWGIATTAAPLALLVGVLALVVKVAVLGVVLAAGEVFLAKLRLFRVPELLAGSFVLALLAVAASFFLA